MNPKTDVLDESNSFIKEIENNLEKTLAKRKEEIALDLQARIQREKDESERRLSEIEGEIARERETLKDYRGTIASFEAERDTLQTDIKSHLDKSIGYQKDIEQLTALTLEELRQLSDLTARLANLRERTELKVTEIRNKLKDKYGVVTEPLDTRESGDVVVNLQQELSKLKQIQAILEEEAPPVELMAPAAEGNAVPQFVPDPSPILEPAVSFAPPEMPVPEAGDFPPAEFKMPEINLFIDEFVKKEEDQTGDASLPNLSFPKWEEPVPVSEPNPVPAPMAVEEVNFQAVFETLEKNRKSEPTDYNGEISFFKNGETTILDGETIIRAMSHLVDDGRKIYQKLGSTESPKDQFFLKQDLINHQEILRKIILRGVKLCEKENSRLPRYTEDVLSVRVLKDVLDRLNLDNWSNEEEFNAFETQTSRIKDAFYKRITPPALYLKSIVQELGA
ncbi:MAG: hypothetical protein ACYDH3_01420 [Candidatus Aminicenantales bacterium]